LDPRSKKTAHYSSVYALAVNAFSLTGSFPKRTGAFEAVVFLG
jgi:hypothetical protein